MRDLYPSEEVKETRAKLATKQRATTCPWPEDWVQSLAGAAALVVHLDNTFTVEAGGGLWQRRWGVWHGLTLAYGTGFCTGLLWADDV